MSMTLPPLDATLARLLLDSVTDEGIFALDAAGRVTFWNPGAAAVLGYAAEEALGMHFGAFFPPEEASLGMPDRVLRRALAGDPAEHEGWRVRKGGERFWAATTITALRDPSGALLGYAKVVRDITERIRAEEALRASEAKFSGIISIATDAIITVDERQRIVHFNQGAEQIFGWTEAEACGRPLADLIPERFHGRHADHVARFGQGGTVAKRMGERQEIFGRRRDGEEFPAEASISRLEVGGRRLFTAVLRDITERKEWERQIAASLEREQEARAAAEAAVRARDDVLHVVSHDLGNSLSAIVVTTTVLLRTLPEPEPGAGDDVRRRIASVRELARRMQRLRQDLLDVASIEAGRLSIEWDRWAPGVLAAEAVEAAAPLAAEKGVALDAEVPDGLPEVEGDRERVLQVLANLLGNAVKFTPAGGHVRLRAGADAREVRFSVHDTGPGIPPEHREHVFERFWKVRDSNRHGAGLGLAIARGIVEAHQGRIWVESAPGQGSAFHFTLPLFPPDGDDPAEADG